MVHHVSSTSDDPRHPVQTVLELNRPSYWVTTGMYPQVIVLKMKSAVYVSSIQVRQSFVKKMKVQCIQSKSVVNTEAQIAHCTDPKNSYKAQSFAYHTHDFQFEGEPADFVQIEIQEAQEEFSIIHSVCVYGESE